jgi:hypothetical protein
MVPIKASRLKAGQTAQHCSEDLMALFGPFKDGFNQCGELIWIQ